MAPIEDLLITRAEIEEYFSIGKNINDNRIDIHIRRAQQSEFKDFVGQEFYYDLVKNPTSSNNLDFMDGVEYQWEGETIFWSGGNQLLATYAMRRIVNANSTFTTRAGQKRKLTEESEGESDSQIRQEARQLKSEAARLEKEANQYLDEKRTDYPLWNQAARKDQGFKTGFRITKI